MLGALTNLRNKQQVIGGNMAKKPVNDKCPHCGGDSGYYRNTVYRVKQEFRFDDPANPQAYYTKLSGGLQARCVDCDKLVDVDF